MHSLESQRFRPVVRMYRQLFEPMCLYKAKARAQGCCTFPGMAPHIHIHSRLSVDETLCTSLHDNNIDRARERRNFLANRMLPLTAHLHVRVRELAKSVTSGGRERAT